MFQERRKHQRRHDILSATQLYRTVRGDNVRSDRRHIPDRRLNDISVDVVECSEYLKEFLKDGSKH